MDNSSPQLAAYAQICELLFGQATLDDWSIRGGGSEYFRNVFERARKLFRAGNTDEAVNIWMAVAQDGRSSSRQTLQAWHFIRQTGSTPPISIAKSVLGVAAEIPMHGAHDMLFAYGDGTVNYVNYSGRAAAWNAVAEVGVQEAVGRWFDVARVMVSILGPWDQGALPVLPAGHMRVAALTPSGPHFGQGPEMDLATHSMVEKFLGAATKVMQLTAGSS